MKKILGAFAILLILAAGCGLIKSAKGSDDESNQVLPGGTPLATPKWVYKADGVVLGDMVSAGVFVSDMGWFGVVQAFEEPYRESLYYETTDCTGQPHRSGRFSRRVTIGWNGNTYMPEGQVATTINHQSTSQDHTLIGGAIECIPQATYSTYLVIPLISNDPNITGIQDYPHTLPITLEKE